MKTTLVLIGTILTVALAGVAQAHPREYIQPSPGLVFAFTDCSGDGVSLSAVCFGSEELNETLVITIDDDVNDPTGGTACQDLDENGICEPSESVDICGSATITVYTSKLLVVFLQSTANGNPATNAICPGEASFATHGFVSHEPA